MNSWTLGKISGINIRVHWTFLLLPIYIYFSSILAGSGLAAAVLTVVFVLAIFGCVLLHELGHALAARQFGIHTRNITLLPIGGVASLERIPRKPLQELWIAVAGPLVNVAIAASLFLAMWLGIIGSFGTGGFLQHLALANVVLVLFNMIPAFPMDGGRVLRSTLAMFTDWNQATEIAVSVGKFAAVGFGILGLLSGNLLLVIVAVFIYFAAHSELVAATTLPNTAWRGVPEQPYENGREDGSDGIWISDASINDADGDIENSVPSTLSTSSVAAWLANRKADYCRVVESGREIGTVTKSQLLVALSRGLGSLPIGNLVRKTTP